MIERCNNPRSTSFKRYGGRGIKVCERWMSFEAFLSDMGPLPTGLTIDRIDNDGNYEPGNCRWATVKEQQNNKSSNLKVTIDGVTRTASEWADRAGIKLATIQSRLEIGWSGADLLKPAQHQRHWTHCSNGHEFTTENTIVNRKGRLCRTCVKSSAVADRAKNRIRRNELQRQRYWASKLQTAKANP